jgi:predicted GNAT superfamily acetyltransferase
MAEARIEIWDSSMCIERADDLAAFFTSLWPEDDWTAFASKIEGRSKLSATVATDDKGAIVGAKLAYARQPSILYSWLGGVKNTTRGAGLATRLMTAQHAWAKESGYRAVETQTRQDNRAMAIVNLMAGYVVSAVEATPGEPIKVLFHKVL